MLLPLAQTVVWLEEARGEASVARKERETTNLSSRRSEHLSITLLITHFHSTMYKPNTFFQERLNKKGQLHYKHCRCPGPGN